MGRSLSLENYPGSCRSRRRKRLVTWSAQRVEGGWWRGQKLLDFKYFRSLSFDRTLHSLLKSSLEGEGQG